MRRTHATWLACAVAAGVMLAVAARAQDKVVEAPPPSRIDTTSVLIQREGDTVRMLNVSIKAEDGKPPVLVDVAMKLVVGGDGRIAVESVETKPTSLIGVTGITEGTYVNGREEYEIKGPSFDSDKRATWTIAGAGQSGTVVAGSPAGNTLINDDSDAVKTLPDAGCYGTATSPHVSTLGQLPTTRGGRTLINVKQVGDTLTITSWALQQDKYKQTGLSVLKKKG